jgi:hypothetical protein
MTLPYHAGIWLPGYLHDRLRRIAREPIKRIWVAVADHFEPFWRNTDEDVAKRRVQLWHQHWPAIAGRHPDTSGRPARYTFFYPEEEYRPHLLDSLADMVQRDFGDVEVHLHHDAETPQRFLSRVGNFVETLYTRHGLLRKEDGRIRFAFIHGNWALDNSRPDGKWCGLNNELTLLKQSGCYADFTMPSGNSPTQARLLNTIYWVTDDPGRPKSYDTGIPLRPGGGEEGDLLMIPGPFGVRWRGRLMPRLESGEIAVQDLPTPYRVRRWLDLAPQVGGDLFLKLHTHGNQERNSAALLLDGGLDLLYSGIQQEASRRGAGYYFVTAWEMWRAIDAIRREDDPIAHTQQRAATR